MKKILTVALIALVAVIIISDRIADTTKNPRTRTIYRHICIYSCLFALAILIYL